jgi:hypothetical protein
MNNSRVEPWFVGLALAACAEPAPPPATRPQTPPSVNAIVAAAVAAISAAPWDTDPTAWGALCSPKIPCDTVVIEPIVAALPAQAPAFFVPDRRPVAATLSGHGFSALTLPGRQVILGDWRECSARREGRNWTRGRVACVAVGIAGPENSRPDAMTFALLVLTPAKGLSWPRIRVTRPQNAWRGRVLSNASE